MYHLDFEIDVLLNCLRRVLQLMYSKLLKERQSLSRLRTDLLVCVMMKPLWFPIKTPFLISDNIEEGLSSVN